MIARAWWSVRREVGVVAKHLAVTLARIVVSALSNNCLPLEVAMNGVLDYIGDRATNTRDLAEDPRTAGVSRFWPHAAA
jgi:hypothetical protein